MPTFASLEKSEERFYLRFNVSPRMPILPSSSVRGEELFKTHNVTVRIPASIDEDVMRKVSAFPSISDYFVHLAIKDLEAAHGDCDNCMHRLITRTMAEALRSIDDIRQQDARAP